MAERPSDEQSPERDNREFVLQFKLLGDSRAVIARGRTVQELEARTVKARKMEGLLQRSVLIQGCREFFAERFHEYLEAGYSSTNEDSIAFGSVIGLVEAADKGIFGEDDARVIEERAFAVDFNKTNEINNERKAKSRKIPLIQDRELSIEVTRRNKRAVMWRAEFEAKYGEELPLLKTA